MPGARPDPPPGLGARLRRRLGAARPGPTAPGEPSPHAAPSDDSRPAGTPEGDETSAPGNAGSAEPDA